jgi:predicted ribosome quality control (RQC) complex YloA/Tae2 family protein
MPPPPPSFDSVVLAAVVREIRPLLPLRIGRVLQTGPLEVVFSLRAPGARGLLLSADARWFRVHLLQDLPDREALDPFGQVLRARFVGARITEITQPPYERVLRVHVEALDGPYVLIAELMGKHANLVLVRDGTVVGAAKAIGPDRSRVRPILPQVPYAPPPPDPRPHPGAVTPSILAEAIQGGQGPLWRRVLGAVSGIGPLVSYELTSRACDPEAEDTSPDVTERIAAELLQLDAYIREGRFGPRLYEKDGEPVAYAPFPLCCLRDYVEVATSMSEAVERVVTHRATQDRREEERRRLLQAVDRALGSRQAALQEAQRALEAAQELGRLRMAGELLLSYASEIPAGQDRVTLPDYEGQPMEIPLDPALNPVQNAQRLFRRYAKLRAAARALPERIAALREEMEFLLTLRVHVEHARTDEDLFELVEELTLAGVLPPPQRRARVRPTTPPRAFEVDGFQVLVGRSSRDNDDLTFRVSAPEDLWLHARGVPGAHVILRTGGRTPPPQTVRKAASIAAYFSAARTSGAVDVDVVERRWVWKPKGARPGVVLYRNERTVRVRPELPGATAVPP